MTTANTSPSASEDGRSFKSGEEMSCKRSNSSNEQTESCKSVPKGRLRKESRGNFGSKGSLLSKADIDNEGGTEHEQISSKCYPKDIHQNPTLQIVRKGKKLLRKYKLWYHLLKPSRESFHIVVKYIIVDFLIIHLQHSTLISVHIPK